MIFVLSTLARRYSKSSTQSAHIPVQRRFAALLGTIYIHHHTITTATCFSNHGSKGSRSILLRPSCTAGFDGERFFIYFWNNSPAGQWDYPPVFNSIRRRQSQPANRVRSECSRSTNGTDLQQNRVCAADRVGRRSGAGEHCRCDHFLDKHAPRLRRREQSLEPNNGSAVRVNTHIAAESNMCSGLNATTGRESARGNEMHSSSSVGRTK